MSEAGFFSGKSSCSLELSHNTGRVDIFTSQPFQQTVIGAVINLFAAELFQNFNPLHAETS